MLAPLLRANFPLVALDRNAERYRYHRLIADMLRGELHRTEPDVEAALHRRASAWHARSGTASTRSSTHSPRMRSSARGISSGPISRPRSSRARARRWSTG